VARVAAGLALARLPGAGACIDLSDGLLADLRHLCAASRVGADLELAALPRPRGFEAACRRLGADPEALLLAGGEDYELLFTLRPGAPPAPALARRLGVPVREIGRIRAGRGVRVRGGRAGARGVGGFRHF
jgi:thiamine-monophosphate kinase